MAMYIDFEEIPTKTETRKWLVKTKDNIVIGIIKWYAPWRRYVLEPHMFSIWDANCLLNIANFLYVEMRKYKETK